MEHPTHQLIWVKTDNHWYQCYIDDCIVKVNGVCVNPRPATNQSQCVSKLYNRMVHLLEV